MDTGSTSSSITVTMDTYGHLFPNDMDRMIEVRDARIREAAEELSRTSRGPEVVSANGREAETASDLRLLLLPG